MDVHIRSYWPVPGLTPVRDTRDTCPSGACGSFHYQIDAVAAGSGEGLAFPGVSLMGGTDARLYTTAAGRRLLYQPGSPHTLARAEWVA